MASFNKKPFLVIIPIFIIGILAIFFTIQLSGASKYSSNGFSFATRALPVPTLVPTKDKTDITEVQSADGTMKLIIKVTSKAGGQTYTFSVSDIAGLNKKTIFMKTLSKNQSLQAPANSWSIDNKYLFLKEQDDGSLSFFVFKANGEPFANGEDYIDVVPLFSNKESSYRIADITGWDSATLLHIFTISANGAKGPSFWFDVESKTFMMLGSE